MREILFRGKRKDNGEWMEGCVLHDGLTGKYFFKNKNDCLDDNLYEVEENNEDGFLQFKAYEAQPETVCQYTEVDDKNGANVFHKDIISAQFTGYGGKKHTRIGVVEYEKGAFCVNWNDSEEYGKNFLGYVNDIEVIGNVFDNPELIGSDND